MHGAEVVSSVQAARHRPPTPCDRRGRVSCVCATDRFAAESAALDDPKIAGRVAGNLPPQQYAQGRGRCAERANLMSRVPRASYQAATRRAPAAPPPAPEQRRGRSVCRARQADACHSAPAAVCPTRTPQDVGDRSSVRWPPLCLKWLGISSTSRPTRTVPGGPPRVRRLASGRTRRRGTCWTASEARPTRGVGRTPARRRRSHRS
jgi:hypothetical protein